MLKRLELQGFKSFREKIIFEFPRGITAIVGPNGAGKSNIVDAIRWVLGEQSLKNLRSGKSDDVIFAGTPQKAATSLASVTLVFDNEKEILPLPYPEVAIGRKLYRDGTSEYAINHAATRLKDLTQLLASARLGVRGLAIINQGAGDVFLRASGEERREMLEEMLGLKELRIKKEDAGRKIEETRHNLGEASRILEELEPHLRSLKRQASRWERRKEKEGVVKTLEERFFLRKMLELQPIGDEFSKEKAALERELSALRETITNEEIHFQELEVGLPKASAETSELREELQALERERTEIARAIGKIEGQIETLAHLPQRDVHGSTSIWLQKAREIKERIQEIISFTDLSKIRTALEELLRNLEDVHGIPDHENASLVRRLETTREKLMKDAEKTNQEIHEVSRKFTELTQSQETFSSQLRASLEVLEKQRHQLREKESLLQEYRFEAEKRRFQEEELRTRMREAGWDFDELSRARHEAYENPTEEPLPELETKILRLRRELADIGLVDEEILREYEETSKRVEFIKNQTVDLGKALQDLVHLSHTLEEKIRQGFANGLETISESFNHYFKLIFGGGSARIFHRKPVSKSGETEGEVLPKGEELPEVDIAISIPRKKIKSIEMLSGGERALTSIAVLFAIVGSSTPPFLVLDEVDAPLDEVNSTRFSRLLRDLATKTQFIVITHNRATMEAAEVLYGVTIEDGASKIFSLKFDEAREVASQDIHAP